MEGHRWGAEEEVICLSRDASGLQASDGRPAPGALADAFHNLPNDLWWDESSLTFFRDAYLSVYQTKYPRNGGFLDYVAMVNAVIAMEGH